MYIYAELWKPKPSWLALPSGERQQFADGIGPAIAAFAASGIELIGFAFNDDDTLCRGDYAYIALWQMPSKEAALELENGVADYGFHDYFEQINARGEIVAPDAVLAAMVAAS
ncbi:MAG: DUF6616 family protein [Pseudomonadota bacterium]